ncbi:PSS-domain-containing protein [Dunaliella salina]|uniref:CDP-diacylglycerol--serine O-phosphatidyltransferase n=1 Tax=Dunaliella salina TaxID=3046 RepID=A0ABQ7GT75_DUNSA|nr:PSS-domain-containing protein [Dunaliella salina]|eukprot:KAF5837811.1 PSS-domain-containing protein [Dunaliella salina]
MKSVTRGSCPPPPATLFSTPRTLTFLSVVLVLIGYHANVFSGASAAREHAGEYSQEQNTKTGIVAVAAVFLGYCVAHGPNTSMVRPHPAVWRAVHGVLVLYALLLVYLVFQDVDDARAFMRHLHPSLGVEINYRTYASDCRLLVEKQPGGGLALNWQGIKSTLLDEFVPAHLIGWWAKALVLRNHFILWVISIGFELLELSLGHMLPNFNECWYDSWVLDVAVCNLIGITLGMATVRWMDCKYERYNWQGLSELKGLGAKARRSLAQLGPYTWDKFQWCQFRSPKRFLQTLFIIVVGLAFELNVFFLKYSLWIPPTNPLITYRLVLWFLMALPAVREWYEYMEGTEAAGAAAMKLGPFAWIAVATVCLETMISIKFGHGLYPRSCPRSVRLAWGIGGGVGAAGFLVWLAVDAWRRRRSSGGHRKEGWAMEQDGEGHSNEKCCSPSGGGAQ